MLFGWLRLSVFKTLYYQMIIYQIIKKNYHVDLVHLLNKCELVFLTIKIVYFVDQIQD